MEYQIITDSCCDLPLDIMKEYNIEVFNFVISIENEELIDDMGLTFNKDQFFKRLKDGAIASTSQVNVHTYIEKFKQYIEKDKPVIYLAFSSELSGSYNNAVQAINILKEEYGTVEISIVDTKAASLGQGLLVYEAAKRKREGMSLSDVVEWIEEVKNSVHSWVTVDDIKHLQRGGRISATAATVGSILSIKPIIVMTSEGKLVPFSKVRGRKKSLHFLVDKTLEGIIEPESQTIFIGHVGVLEDAEYVKELLESRQKFKQVVITSYGPTVASHTGFGSLAVFSFGKEK
ncbi:DegV family protein [Marinilactibacillus psychrotolerans]|uniref:DegV family protein n=1 Tax=Marinilactibacillus psychrotolerans TaxID=191770 RepID=UPI00388AFFB0